MSEVSFFKTKNKKSIHYTFIHYNKKSKASEPPKKLAVQKNRPSNY